MSGLGTGAWKERHAPASPRPQGPFPAGEPAGAVRRDAAEPNRTTAAPPPAAAAGPAWLARSPGPPGCRPRGSRSPSGPRRVIASRPLEGSDRAKTFILQSVLISLIADIVLDLRTDALNAFLVPGAGLGACSSPSVHQPRIAVPRGLVRLLPQLVPKAAAAPQGAALCKGQLGSRRGKTGRGVG